MSFVGERVAMACAPGVQMGPSMSFNDLQTGCSIRMGIIRCRQNVLNVSARIGAGVDLQRGGRHSWKIFEAQQRKERKQAERIVISASSTGGKEFYQPFRRPPPQQNLVSNTAAVAGGALTIEEQLEILRDRQGLWFAFATVIPSLGRAGFTPSEIDEATGLNGHEQNQLVVGAQVRDSLKASGLEMEALDWFDVGGAERLYELRILSAQERKAAALFVIEKDMDAKLVRDLSRSVKDFSRRKNTEGFAHFTTAPGDCLAFALYRQSKETTNEAEAENILNRALEFAVTERARAKIRSALNRGGEETTVEPDVADIKVLVMRLSSEKLPVVLPVAEFTAEALEAAPYRSAGASDTSGTFNIYKTDTPWKSWISIPSWRPITYAVAPVALLVPDGTVLPKSTGIELVNAPILVVVDKGDTEIQDGSFHLVTLAGGVTLQAGHQISPNQTVLGKVVIALKPPLPLDPNANPEDWD